MGTLQNLASFDNPSDREACELAERSLSARLDDLNVSGFSMPDGAEDQMAEFYASQPLDEVSPEEEELHYQHWLSQQAPAVTPELTYSSEESQLLEIELARQVTRPKVKRAKLPVAALTISDVRATRKPGVMDQPQYRSFNDFLDSHGHDLCAEIVDQTLTPQRQDAFRKLLIEALELSGFFEPDGDVEPEELEDGERWDGQE